jgi:hypothetical protein
MCCLSCVIIFIIMFHDFVTVLYSYYHTSSCLSLVFISSSLLTHAVVLWVVHVFQYVVSWCHCFWYSSYMFLSWFDIVLINVHHFVIVFSVLVYHCQLCSLNFIVLPFFYIIGHDCNVCVSFSFQCQCSSFCNCFKLVLIFLFFIKFHHCVHVFVSLFNCVLPFFSFTVVFYMLPNLNWQEHPACLSSSSIFWHPVPIWKTPT